MPILLLSRASEQWARTVEQTGSVLKRVQLQVEREALCESIAQAPTKSHTPKDTVIFVGTCELLTSECGAGPYVVYLRANWSTKAAFSGHTLRKM